MSDPQTLHHLADAIKALRAAWNICDGDKVYEHIVEAESNVFRAIREIANGQVAPDEAQGEAQDEVLGGPAATEHIAGTRA